MPVPARSARWILSLILVLAGSPRASARELQILQFNSEVVVRSDGVVSVTETIRVRFVGSWKGLYREIPVEYENPQKLNYTLFLDIQGVTDGDGQNLKYESSRDRHYRKLKIFVPDARDAEKTVVIAYTVSDALRFFEDHDEFYWNVTGDEWDVPIQSAGAHIVLPDGAAHIRVNVFTGSYGSREQDAEAEINANGVDVHTRGPLPYHGGLTVAVAFDKGAVREPGFFARAGRFLRSNWPLGLPVLAFVFMFRLWWTRGRDPRLRPIAAQYQPPDGLTPGEVGTLVDNSADMRDITASIVDLAVRGFLVIEELTKEHLMGLWSDKDYRFILKKGRSEWNSLKPFEEALLDGIFDSGTPDEAVSMSSLENKFYKNLPTIKNRIFESLVGRGYYRRRPDSVRAAYVAAAVVAGFLSIWGGSALAGNLGIAPLSFIAAGILTALVVLGFGWFMPARTEQGARTLEGVLGFEDFLGHVESDRFNRMIKTPEMFEKFLPFAMALGVEKNWSKAFRNIYTEPPGWYQGGGFGPSFYPMAFVNNLNVMSSQAGSVFASAPRSSGGSGFGGGGGGGSSGGGFGGGGGGGF